MERLKLINFLIIIFSGLITEKSIKLRGEIMSVEKSESKPLNTYWDPVKKQWLICMTLGIPSTNQFISIDLDGFQQNLLNNPTYQKFSNRLAENVDAILENRARTQQHEGGYTPQIISAAVSAFLTLLSQAMNPIFTYLRWRYPDTQSDDSKNNTRTSIENSAFTIQLFLSFFLIMSYTALFYLVFFRTDREKKQKQLFELMETLRKRIPAIEAEIKIKQQTIEQLEIFLQAEDQSLMMKPILTLSQIPHYQWPNIVNTSLNKHIENKNALNMQSPNMGDIESNATTYMPLSTKRKELDQKVILNFRDIVKIILDSNNDLNAYNEIVQFIQHMNDSAFTENGKELNEIIFTLLKLKFISAYSELFDQKQNLEIISLESIFHLLSYASNVNIDSHPSLVSPVYTVAKVLLDLLRSKEKIAAINHILHLLELSHITTCIHTIKLKRNLLFQLNSTCDEKFSNTDSILERTAKNLSEILTRQALSKLLPVVKGFFPNESIGYPEIVRANFEKLIKYLANTMQLINIVGITKTGEGDQKTTSLNRYNHYFGHITGITQIVKGNFEGREVIFNVYRTKGDGNCGFYSLPIPYDRQGIVALLLENRNRLDIRSLVAREIIESLFTNDLPEAMLNTFKALQEYKASFDKQDNVKQKLLSTALDVIDPERKHIPNRHFESVLNYLQNPENQKHEKQKAQYEKLKKFKESDDLMQQEILNFCSQQKVFKYYIKAVLGTTGWLSFTRAGVTVERTGGVLEAILQLAQPSIRLYIWQPDLDKSPGRAKIVYAGGPKEGTVTHIYHTPGTAAHFELMSEAEINLVLKEEKQARLEKIEKSISDSQSEEIKKEKEPVKEEGYEIETSSPTFLALRKNG